MSEDDVYLLISYIIFGVTLAILVAISKHKISTAAINLTIATLYSALFLYKMTCDASGSVSLGWYVSLLVSLGLHWLINLLGLLFFYIEKSSLRKKN